MSKFCPVYPKPKTSRASLLWMFFRKRRSWLDGLFERSYRMKMGQVLLPGLDVYMVNQPELVRRILVTEAEKFPKHKLLGMMLEPLLGESIFTTNGAIWEMQRRMLDPAFAQARLKNVFPLMRDAGIALCERLDRLQDGAVHDLEVEMTHVTADIIFRTILSQKLDGDNARKVFDAFTRFQALAPRVLLPRLYRLPAWLRPSKTERRLREAGNEIRSLLEHFIRPRYEACRAGNPGEYQDILSVLLDVADPETGKRFDYEELVDQVAMLFLAGHETSASALSWSLYLIASVPEIQQRMYEEGRAVLGRREPDYADIKKLRVHWNVFREALRLYPPVGFFAREVTQTTRMRDKTMSPGASVVISPWLIHRHRELWERPDEFDPDRHDSPEARESLRCAYLPFGMGPRVCIGAAFAMQEAVLILAMLVQRYRFEAVPGVEPRPVGRLTVRSENGIRVRLNKRSEADEAPAVRAEALRG